MRSLDIHELIKARVAMLTTSNPDLTIDKDVENDTWGLLTIWDQGHLVGFEFLETEGSWMRPDAAVQYTDASRDGYYVGVLLPEQVLEQAIDTVLPQWDRSLVISTYESLGVVAAQRA